MSLTAVQIAELDRLEKIVEVSMQTWREAGDALKKIRDQRLYLRDYNTFEVYLQERWKMSRSRGYQLIDASDVVKSLPDRCLPVVDTERSARELAKFPVPVRKEIVKEAQKNGEPVAAVVRKNFPSSPPLQKKPSRPDDSSCRDETGFVIPKKLLPLWERRDEVQQLLSSISTVRCTLEKAREDNDILFVGAGYGSAIIDLKHAANEIRGAKLYAVCTSCQGAFPNRCTLCKGKGFLSHLQWEQSVPNETKAIRQRVGK